MIELLLAVALSVTNDALPPVKYQGNTAAIVVTIDNPNSKNTCGVAPEGYVTLACAFKKKGAPIVLMPNPCRYPEAADELSYAHLLCHELGHVNGWNSTHDN
jgi:hypothetical protein